MTVHESTYARPLVRRMNGWFIWRECGTAIPQGGPTGRVVLGGGSRELTEVGGGDTYYRAV